MKRRLALASFLIVCWFVAPVHADPEPKSLPAKFDLRKVDGVTPIKKQMGGTCWAHGTMAAIESHMLVSGAWKSAGLSGFPALSEYHLDWWNGFNQHKNEDLVEKEEDKDKPKTGLRVHVGGDYRVSTAYMSRGDGVVVLPRDKDDNPDITGWYKAAPERHDASYRRFYVRNVEWFTIGDKLENIDTIKRRIMKHGAMGTAYAVGKLFLSKDFVHYQPADSKSLPNHAVAIIGWDDEKVTEDKDKLPPKPGAWLIKNSWGDKKGDAGYYWISYYDKCCCRDPEMGAVSFRNVEPLKYSHVYLHDYHGWRDTLKTVSKAFNAFTAVDDHSIQSVSFYTAKDNVKYTFKIYSRFDGGRLDGELAHLTGVIEHTGFHTLDLAKAVHVKTKQKFYLCLELSDGGQPIDRTSEIPVLLEQKGKGSPKPIVISKATAGESYYWDEGAWKDLHEYRFENPMWGTFDRTANFCMKALAVRAGTGAER